MQMAICMRRGFVRDRTPKLANERIVGMIHPLAATESGNSIPAVKQLSRGIIQTNHH